MARQTRHPLHSMAVIRVLEVSRLAAVAVAGVSIILQVLTEALLAGVLPTVGVERKSLHQQPHLLKVTTGVQRIREGMAVVVAAVLMEWA